MSRPRIALVTTGGTIQAVGRTPDDLDEYMDTGLTIEPSTLLDTISTEALGVTAVLEPFDAISSPDIADSHWLRLVETLERIATEVDGIVLSHGTNTLEETALFLSLTFSNAVPLVLTGAMRPSSARCADGPSNLVAAFRVVAASGGSPRGVQAVFADRVFDPAFLTKSRTDSLVAFDAGEVGCSGFVDTDGRVRFATRSAPRHPTVLPPAITGLARVDVVIAHANADGVAIEAFVEAGARGLVLSGTGSGHPTAAQRQALEAARDSGVTICRTSRSSQGVALRHSGFPEWLAGGRLRPWQARVVLSVGLSAGLDQVSLQNLLDGQNADSPERRDL